MVQKAYKVANNAPIVIGHENWVKGAFALSFTKAEANRFGESINGSVELIVDREAKAGNPPGKLAVFPMCIVGESKKALREFIMMQVDIALNAIEKQKWFNKIEVKQGEI